MTTQPAPRRGRRLRTIGAADDRVTRQKILDAAGHVFAQRGFDRATGKEITRLAAVNSAAINYYFGGIEKLYAAVLEAAHSRLMPLAAMTAAVGSQKQPKQKLRAVIDLLAAKVTGPISATWAFRLIGREVASPSPAFAALREKEILPKMRLMRQIVGSIMNLPLDHPAVARGCVCIFAPFLLLLIGDRPMLARGMPALNITPKDAASLADHMFTYAIAGLAAVRRGAR